MRLRIAMIAAVVLLCHGAVPAQGTQAQPRMWQENFDYRVQIDGVLSPQARLFSSNGRPSMLLMAPELKQPIVLQVDGREVMMVNAAAIEGGPVPDKVILPDSEIHGPASPYTMNGDVVVFFLDGRKVQLMRKPPIVGAMTMEEILVQLPAYRKGMEAYSPAESDTSYLRAYRFPVQIEVFFGSWCPHCRETVPRFLKTINVISNANIKVSMVGVPVPPFIDYPPAKEKSVQGVPTFIVYAEDKEIGRVNSIPGDSSVEHELVKVLFKYEQGKG